MINVLDQFPEAKIQSDGKWYKATCPECGRAMALSISAESGYYHCFKCKHKGKIGNGQIKSPAAVVKSSHDKNTERFIEHFQKIMTHESLDGIWSDIALTPELGLGYTRDGKLQFGIYKNGELKHVKNHKGRQYGEATNKIYPEIVLDRGKADGYLWIAEGEKDCITAICHGLQCITFTSGAGAIPKDISKLERFTNIVICYDNDTPGKEGSMKVAKKLALDLPKAKITIFEWENRDERYDLTDFFREGNKVDDLYSELDKNGYVFGKDPKDYGGMRADNFFDYMKMDAGQVKWICQDIITEKSVGMLAAVDNAGKSIFAYQMGMCIAMGVPFMNFKVPRPRKILCVQFEMSDAMQIDRLQKMYNYLEALHPDKVHLLRENFHTVPLKEAGKIFVDKWERLQGNLMAKRNDQYDLVIVDNLYSSTSKDISKNHEVVKVLSFIRDLVDQFGVSIFLVNHHNKKTSDIKILDKDSMRGGKVISDVVEYVHQIAEASVDPLKKLRIFKITKSRMASDLKNIACGITLEGEDGKLYFDWKGPLPKKEELYYTESAENKDFEILNDLLALRDNQGEIKTIQVEGVLADYDMSRATVFRWIQKQVGFGTLKKSGHGAYKIAENDLWNLLQ